MIDSHDWNLETGDSLSFNEYKEELFQKIKEKEFTVRELNVIIDQISNSKTIQELDIIKI